MWDRRCTIARLDFMTRSKAVPSGKLRRLSSSRNSQTFGLYNSAAPRFVVHPIRKAPTNDGSIPQERLRLLVQPLPVTKDLPAYVVSGLDITLDQLSDGAVTVVQNLPAEC